MTHRRLPVSRCISLCLCLMLLLSVLCGCGSAPADLTAFREKAALLKEQLVTESMAAELGSTPAGSVGHAVFLSVCDTQQRASVFTGTGSTLEEAWDAAQAAAEASLEKSGLEAVWVKADVVHSCYTISAAELSEALLDASNESLRYGIAFDAAYSTALLEAELNGNRIYDYENGGITLEYLNNYLQNAGRESLSALPMNYLAFQTFGRFCDENNNVYKLGSGGSDYGRRKVDHVDAAMAEELIATASAHLAEQVQEDGSFVYGYYPRFDNLTSSYNILRHAGTVWALVCRYRMTGEAELAATIEKAIDYLLSQVVYADDTTAYVYEAVSDEIKLGGCGLAVIALTEYMDAFGSDKYAEVCTHLGNGILSLLNTDDGTYYHVLNGDLTRKEAFRTVYYDGEATFALCRLYSLTGDEQWLNAAKAAVEHFIAADYVQYRDQWVAYSMNEITKYVEDARYYAFALRNVQENYGKIDIKSTAPVTFELLMITFELYDRLLAKDAGISGFDQQAFLDMIDKRANFMLNGYFYPEFAMYMNSPQTILGAFMVREDGFRTRIDDVQHCIGGYYLYHKHYDKLIAMSMAE